METNSFTISHYKNKLLKDGRCSRDLNTHTVTNSELNQNTSLFYQLFSIKTTGGASLGTHFKKVGTFLQSCGRWCWEDNSIVIGERVQLALVCMKSNKVPVIKQ